MDTFYRLTTIAGLQAALGRVSPASTLGFVPTMGALHGGHAALIQRARQECDVVVVSIFVNPLQFGPQEDLHRYPRALEADTALCQQLGVDLLFVPSVAELYPAGMETLTVVEPPKELTERLCGRSRPGHFSRGSHHCA